jgi:hypothetical protein
MTYRSSLHFRINLSVGIAFAWFALVLLLLTFAPGLGTDPLLWTFLGSGLVAVALLAYVWADWTRSSRL